MSRKKSRFPRNWFNRSLPLVRPKLSGYDLYQDHKTSINFGLAIPYFVDECLPADVHFMHTDIFMRLAPLKYPVMQRLKIHQKSFFCPTRLLLGNDTNDAFWQSDTGLSTDDMPHIRVSTEFTNPFGKGKLCDYFGVQPFTSSIIPYYILENPLPLLAYHLIMAENYSDEVLDADYIDGVHALLERYRSAGLAGDVTLSASEAAWFFVPRPVSYDRDYFTSARPEAQRGDEVYIMNPMTLVTIDGEPALSQTGNSIQINSTGTAYSYLESGVASQVGLSTTIRDLWIKMAVQRMRNRKNNYGTDRYLEYLAAFYGIVPQDARLQRPEFIKGSTGVFNISEVLQTSATEAESPLGAFAGKGIAGRRTAGLKYLCLEHGWLMSICTLVPDNVYMTGAPRWWFKKNSLDFFHPYFQDIGEQQVYSGEIYMQNVDQTGNAKNRADWAYQSRYSEYRAARSYVSGDFRESPLLAWHTARGFNSLPPFNDDFIHVSQEDVNRIFNDNSDLAKVYCDFSTSHTALRPVKKNPQ